MVWCFFHAILWRFELNMNVGPHSVLNLNADAVVISTFVLMVADIFWYNLLQIEKVPVIGSSTLLSLL